MLAYDMREPGPSSGVFCCSVNDPEEANPAYRARPMSDHPESDHRDTDMAPARDTLPPDEDDREAARVMGTMVPPKPDPRQALEPDESIEKEPKGPASNDGAPSYWKEAYDTLVKVHGEQRDMITNLHDPNGGFAQLITLVVKRGTDSVVAQLEPRFKGIEDKVSALERLYNELKEETARKLQAFEGEIRALKESRGTAEAAPPGQQQ
jgi:hypothetical protein